MATILKLVERGELVKLDVELGPSEMEQRCIYFHHRCAGGLYDRLSKMVSQWKVESSPIEQFDELTYHFVTGDSIDFPRQFRDLIHRRDGIWELKTPDLRLFGWFATMDCFICTDVADANEVKHGPKGAVNFHGSLYAGYCEQAGYWRDQLDLDEPKFLTGRDPQDVVTNSYRSKP